MDVCKLLPLGLREAVVALMDKTVHVPSKSKISRSRASMDAAWILCAQSWLFDGLDDDPLNIAIQIDSSPQAHRDYEMLLVRFVRDSVLASLHDLVVEAHDGPRKLELIDIDEDATHTLTSALRLEDCGGFSWPYKWHAHSHPTSTPRVCTRRFLIKCLFVIQMVVARNSSLYLWIALKMNSVSLTAAEF